MLPGAFVSCLLGPGYWPWASEWAVHGHWTAPSKSSVIYVETLCPSSFVTTVGFFFFFLAFFCSRRCDYEMSPWKQFNSLLKI